MSDGTTTTTASTQAAASSAAAASGQQQGAAGAQQVAPPAASQQGGADAGTQQAAQQPSALKWADGVPEDFRNSYAETTKKLGVSGEHAQGLADFLASRSAAMREAAVKSREAEVASWKKAVEADPELGGAKLQATYVARDAALNRYASEGLKKLLKDNGVEDHPEVVAHFARLGLANGESTTAGTQAAAAGNAKTSLKAVYPNSPTLKFD